MTTSLGKTAVTSAGRPLRLDLESGDSLSALLTAPPSPVACYVFAHGAGAGMDHPFMQTVAAGLADRRIATIRYQFPFMERGSRRPDTPAVAHAAVRAAVAVARQATGLPILAGGKSFGGRMTSQAQALSPLPDVIGLAFLGFPLHPPDKPSTTRADHLVDVQVPMLFVQGTRDKLAQFTLIEKLVTDLSPRATLLTIEHADHGFDVLVRSGRKPADVMTQVLDGFAAWTEATLQGGR